VLYAVITAGGRVDGEFARTIQTDVKALAPVGSRRLIDAALDAARGIEVAAIAVVGGPEVRRHCGDRVERVIDAAEDGAQNIQKALRAFPGCDLVYLTSDLPFIEAGGLRDFVDRAQGCAAAMPLADAAVYERAFPGAPGRPMSLGGERFASGTVFLFAAAAAGEIERLAGAFFDARKSRLRLARLCGPGLLLRYLLGTLRVSDLEARASRVLGGPVRAVRGSSPGLCYDVDRLEDWEYARTRI
jgi:CTP:molybdopterin cytidylyltransferase MocA